MRVSSPGMLLKPVFNAMRMVTTEIFRINIQATIPYECVIYFVDGFREKNLYSIKVFKIKANVGRTRAANNIFNLKFTISTIVKHIASVSSSLYFYPSKFADIIHRRLDFKTSVDGIRMVICCTLLQFLLNDKKKKDLAFLSFSIEDDRKCRIECQAVGDVQFERQRVSTNKTKYSKTLMYMKLMSYWVQVPFHQTRQPQLNLVFFVAGRTRSGVVADYKRDEIVKNFCDGTRCIGN
ncbi:hypothetical protein YC2023_082676 [Brassica napus]